MDYKDGGIPKTIEELKDYCERNGFTASKTRFFIGFNYQGPRAFGIYKDEETGEYVVYKNKDDGTRNVRYRGTDEEFAVVELYDRLQKEIDNQKLHYAAEMAERERNKYEGRSSGTYCTLDDNADSYEYIKNFHASDYPINSFVDEAKEYFNNNENDSHSSYDHYDYRGHSNSQGGGALGVIISIVILILSLLFGFGGGGFSSYDRYDSGYSSYSSYDSYDSGCSSDNWDSGSTDWGSDW
jgi:hypothetical protein